MQGGAAVEGRLGHGWAERAAAAAAAAHSRSLTSVARCSSCACCCSSPRMVAAVGVEGRRGLGTCMVAAPQAKCRSGALCEVLQGAPTPQQCTP